MTRDAAGVATHAGAEPTSRARRLMARSLRRLRRDQYVTYTALLAPIAGLSALADGQLDDFATVLMVTPVFVAAQILLGLPSARRREQLGKTGWSLVRLSVPLLFVAVLVATVGGPQLPLLSLYLPVVVAAAALGAVQAVTIGGVATLVYLVPVLVSDQPPAAIAARAIAHAGVAALLAVTTRQLVTALERAVAEMRRAALGERRRSRQIAALERVSQVIVAGGEISEVLDGILGVLADRVGYRYVSIYLWNTDKLILGASANYASPPAVILPGVGVVGGVATSHTVAYVPDVRLSPAYVAVHDQVVSEVCAPLLIEGAFLGVLNVESTDTLDHTDRDLITALAQRVATVVALGRNRDALAERVNLFRALHEFSSAVSATLRLEELASTLVDWAGRLVPADVVTVAILDEPSGRYVVRATTGPREEVLEFATRPADGATARAIKGRVTVVDEGGAPEHHHAPDGGRPAADAAVEAAVPLISRDVVVGAIRVGRTDPGARFTPLEIEGLELLAGHAALAVANAYLHARVEELAIRDPLTGLYNRRHFDEAVDHVLAAHRRDAGDPSRASPRPLAAIMFDIDQFGAVNKQHGHQVGDAVLRAFGSILARRFRAADLIARYGGEEFVAILDGATLTGALQVADEVREAFARTTVRDEAGKPLTVTVSAGCAALDDAELSREALLRTADVALFMAKRAGRNRVVAA